MSASEVQHVEQVAPGVVRVRADNPGPMTLDGTNTWILSGPGAAGAVVIDPGPDDATHRRRVRAQLDRAGLAVDVVLLTHGHLDHSEGAAAFARAVDAPLRAADPRWCTGRPLAPQESIDAADGLHLTVVATPGHTSDSVSFATGSYLLTGDTVLGRGTTVVAHPDGTLSDYLASLTALREHATGDVTHLLPGHGPTVTAPLEWLDYYLTHRRERLDAVAAAVRELDAPLTAGEDELTATVDAVVARVYADVPRHLWPAAALSVRAQLLYLRDATGWAAPSA